MNREGPHARPSGRRRKYLPSLGASEARVFSCLARRSASRGVALAVARTYALTMAETMLVTGANRGIGLAVCRELAKRGYNVVVTARRVDAAQRALGEFGSGQSVGLVPRQLDVTDEASITSLAKWIRAEGIRLGALINNAGVSLNGFDAEVARDTLETNTLGPMRLTDALLGELDDGARVVNVSSGMGHLSGFGSEVRRGFEQARTRADLVGLLAEFVEDVRVGRHRKRGWPSNAYSVSKAGLNLFTRILAAERPRLRVNSVCPGWVRTDMGGSGAPRSVEKGAAGVAWAATLPSDGPTGGFFRDGARIDW